MKAVLRTGSLAPVFISRIAGLANKRLGNLEDALQAFKKLHRIVSKDPLVIYQIANLCVVSEETSNEPDVATRFCL